MTNIGNKVDKILSLMPQMFVGKKNITALMSTLGQSDQEVESLFLEVKKQFFIDTATGDFLEKLGQNNGVLRPPSISVQDTDYRQFIKLMSYYPKQIRQIVYRLMELFYGVESTRASVQNLRSGPYNVIDGALLQVRVDARAEPVTVQFRREAFVDPDFATAGEIVSVIQDQVGEFLLPVLFSDNVTGNQFVQLYSRTPGPAGKISVVGGNANRFLKFPDILDLGQNINTRYRVFKKFSSMEVYWAGGPQPNFAGLEAERDVIILSGTGFLSRNRGSFQILNVVNTGVPAELVSTSSAVWSSGNLVDFTVADSTDFKPGEKVLVTGFSGPTNNTDESGLTSLPFFTVDSAPTPTTLRLVTSRTSTAADEVAAGTIDRKPSATRLDVTNELVLEQSTPIVLTNADDVLFFRPVLKKLESVKRLATAWEVGINELVITLPTTPAIVKRNLEGSCHLQGTTAKVASLVGTTLNLESTKFFPQTEGRFYLQSSGGAVRQLKKYTYVAKSLNSIQNVAPTDIDIIGTYLNLISGPLSVTTGSNVLTVSTNTVHELILGETVLLEDFDDIGSLPSSAFNGRRAVASIIDDNTFTVIMDSASPVTGTNAPSNKGRVRTAKGSVVVITNVGQNTGYISSYVYQPKGGAIAPAALRGALQEDILAGAVGKDIQVTGASQFPSTPGYIVFNYGREDQEGPVKYIARPNPTTLFLDPSYSFKKTQLQGSTVNLVSSLNATVPRADGSDYAAFITDTFTARESLKALIKEAAAASIAIRFILILPENVYNAYSLYETGESQV